MADSKLKTRSRDVSAESLSMGAAAESIATGGGTIPQNAGNIHFYVPVGDNVHWHPSGTPTSTFGHAVKAGNWGMLRHSEQGALIISDDASDVALILVYERGAGRQDNGSYALTAPY